MGEAPHTAGASARDGRPERGFHGRWSW